MKKAFVHYLITRYNLAIEGRPEWVSGSKCLDADWLRYRKKLFELYCLPSILAQSNMDFVWVLLFHPETPVEYLNEIMDLLDGRVERYVIWQESANWYVPIAESQNWRTIVKGSKFGESSHVITTRLDSDDAIHRDFIDGIQSEFDYQERRFVEYTFGCVFDVVGRQVYRVKHLSNSFVSLIERKTDSLTSVFCGDHAVLRDVQGNFTNLEEGPGWLQVCHGSNLSNSIDRVEGIVVPEGVKFIEAEFSVSVVSCGSSL